MHELTRIKESIWQVEEARGVYFTIIKGKTGAIVMDTGHGIADNKAFVESVLDVPYVVINSHGHPDHTQGNYQFDEVYMHPSDVVAYERCNTYERRKDSYLRLCEANNLPKDKAEEFANIKVPKTLSIEDGKEFDLGGIHVVVVALPGHTKGTIALLVKEEKILVAGDAFNPEMWMFADNHDTLDTLFNTFNKALSLEFDAYLGGHTTLCVEKEFLSDARENVIRRDIDWNSFDVILGRRIYEIVYEGAKRTSRIAIPIETAFEITEAKNRGFNTILLHGSANDKNSVDDANGMIHTPIYQTSAFAHESAESIADCFAKKKQGYNYTRLNNPTLAEFERCISALEHGEASVALSSGMAAISNGLLNILSAGDEFITTTGLYGGTIDLFKNFAQFNITAKYVKVNDFEAIRASITDKTKLLFTETISNPGLEVTDIEEMAKIAHEHNIPLIVDNTMATALLTKPIELGADIVINSTSKYVNGSGNSISGVITDACRINWDFVKFPELKVFENLGNKAYITKIRAKMVGNFGGCLSPQNAYLNLIGLETMGLRFERECNNALALSKHLSKVLGVTVNYPGLPGKGADVANKVLKGGYGAILTVRLGSREKAFKFMNELRIPFIVSNIGDVRTLVVHPASTMALHSTEEERNNAGVFDDLVRVSVGIENIEDLIADFDRAIYLCEQ